MPDRSDRYTQIESTLALAEITELTPSEVHGTVVGAIINHLKTGITPELLKLVAPEAQAGDGRFARLNELLYEMYRETGELLFDSKEGFELVLPDDDEPLAWRVEGLATWSKGFLLGMLYNDRFSIDQLPESGPEIARDMFEISEAGSGDEDQREEEFAFVELEEYLKVGAQLIFEFIYSEQAADAPSQAH
ncbi:UPF0149 family protein [Arenicella xantha]|uniref:Uncharacterized protein n=1 Tax=Arenicella xantha TaxID=644221 RepID=A0A395JK81_9GAMM|nr:UPF0149 family protein [Arenicella xantha]RBP49631.1 hypothetical protein DFR28_10356 [Arenicella xantha]